MLDAGLATELMSQTATAAGAGGGAVGVVSGGLGVAFLARYLFKRMVDGYDKQLAKAEATDKEQCERTTTLEVKVAVLEAMLAEVKGLPGHVEAKLEVCRAEALKLEADVGVAHRRIERLAEKTGTPINDIQKRQ